jgi:hypothetical protein
MKNLTEFVIGVEMKFYHQKMQKKLLGFGLMFIELVDSSFLSLRKFYLSVRRRGPLAVERSMTTVFEKNFPLGEFLQFQI